MTSVKQLAANRENAKRSTGPKTTEGKAIARLNALKHGGLSPLPVLPDLERADEWEAHPAGIMASLQPTGYLEAVLAERVALLLWRLKRVARAEREAIAVGRERVVEDLAERRGDPLVQLRRRARGPEHPDELRRALRDARERRRALERLCGLPGDTHIAGEEAAIVLTAVADETRAVDPETFSMPRVVPDDVAWEEYDGWTAERVGRGIAAMAAAERVGADALLGVAIEQARHAEAELKAEADRVATELDHLRRERLLPDEQTLAKLSRYEAHLSRQLAQALHELQRRQAARSADPVPPPAVVDVTVSGFA